MRRLSVATVTVVAVLCAFMVVCFARPAPAQTAGAPAKSKESPKAAAAVRGGILRGIRGQFPKDMSYAPEWSPTDSMFALPFAERLVDWDEKGNLVPQLATSFAAAKDVASALRWVSAIVRSGARTPAANA